MRKKRATLTAERVLKQAIAEETSAMRAEFTAKLEAAEMRNVQLEDVLARIAALAGQVERSPQPLVQAANRAPLVEAPLPQGQAVPLADGDEMGEGRWA